MNATDELRRESGGRMSITDELREAIATLEVRLTHNDHDSIDIFYPSPSRREFAAIADRIDAEHEAKVSYWQEASYRDGYDEGFASADDWLAQHEDAMAEHGWVKLPVSEDGDVLYIGELVDEKLPFGGYAAPAPIDTMELSRGANGYVWMVKLDAENRALINPKLLRHHHAPTVEDVLRGFAEKITDSQIPGVHPTYEEAIAEYAQRLQLREVDE